MRYIRYFCIAAFALALIAVALGNRGFVEIKLLPDQLASLTGLDARAELPLFMIVYGGILVGFA
ncbi:MAG: DUF1049 domain-containing protein, partial [Arenibacterium sp.]